MSRSNDPRGLEGCANDVMTEVVRALGAQAGGRMGGALRIFRSLTPEMGFSGWSEWRSIRVGAILADKRWEAYEFTAMEKFLRLAVMYARYQHVSCWQSRDPELWRWGGGFVFPIKLPELPVSHIVTFSGLPEMGDEAFILRFMQKKGWMPEGLHEALVRHSQNRLALDLCRVAA